jgi:hypothetical protein
MMYRLSALADLQVSHLSGGNMSLCRHSRFGGDERQRSLLANEYFRPSRPIKVPSRMTDTTPVILVGIRNP